MDAKVLFRLEIKRRNLPPPPLLHQAFSLCRLWHGSSWESM